MCGIVGLFAKKASFEPELGAHLAAMLGVMCDRGPDSAGFAIYRAGSPDEAKLTLRVEKGCDVEALAAAIGAGAGIKPRAEIRDTHAVLAFPRGSEAAMRDAIAKVAPEAAIVGAGSRMEIYKEAGLPTEVAARFRLEEMSASHGIAHTRMATESAVTTRGAHPFSTGPDQCLVHNGSLSNHNGVRRMLEREGFRFETDNDSEVAAGFISWRMSRGDSLRQALASCLSGLDGFFTFVAGTESGFAVLRDPIACKPAVMAETEDYVAFGSEYRALAMLPGVGAAKVWEPEPARVYVWERAAA